MERREKRAGTTEKRRRRRRGQTRKKKRERIELKPPLALALGLKSSEGFLLARHLTKQLEVNPFLHPFILFLRIYVPKLRRFLTPCYSNRRGSFIGISFTFLRVSRRLLTIRYTLYLFGVNLKYVVQRNEIVWNSVKIKFYVSLVHERFGAVIC